MADFKTTWFMKLKHAVLGPLDKIIQKAGGAEKAIAKIRLQQKKLEDLSGSLESKLRKLTVGAAAFAALSYGSLQFEDGMAKANTMAGLGVEKFAELEDQMRGVASVIPKVRTELTEGLYQTISNGVPENNWIQFLEDSSKAAVGGAAEIGEVVGVTSTIIKNYAMEWERAGDIQDKIQKTAKFGKTSFSELGNSLPRVTGKAATLKIGIDELLGSFAALTGVTGNTSEVSTQMNAVLTALVKPTSEAAEMAKKMGVEFNSLSIGKAGGLIPFLDQLKSKTESYVKVNGGAAVDVYGKLFGSAEAVTAINNLTGKSADDFKRKTLEIADSAGTVEQAFSGMSSTTTSQLQLMRNRFENNMDRIVKNLESLKVMLFDSLNTVLEWFSAFQENNPVLSKWLVLITGGSLALTTLGLVVGIGVIKLISFYKEMKVVAIMMRSWTIWSKLASIATAAWTAVTSGASTAFAALNAIMTANPIGAIIVAVVALTAVVTAAIKKYDDWGAALLLFLGPLGAVVNIIQSFRRNWDMVVEAFKTDGIIGGLKAVGKVLLDALLMPLQQLMEIIHNVTGFDWAAKAAKGLENTRTKLGVTVETKGAEPEKAKAKKSVSASKYADNRQTETPVTASAGGGSISTGGGSGVSATGGGRTVKQHNEVHMHFTLPENWRDQLEDIKAEMLGVFGRAASDAAIVGTK